MSPTAVTHRNSVGLESTLSGAPPPCYSSQMDSDSATPTLDGDDIQDDDDADDDQHSITGLRTEFYQLPSPYSAEELASAPQTYCSHGYTHTHSQCTSSSPTVYNPSLNPHIMEMSRSSQGLPAMVTPPRPRTLRYSSLPSPYDDHDSPARLSSYHTHHPVASYSTHGHLTYLSHDTHDLHCGPQENTGKGPYAEPHVPGGSTPTISFPQTTEQVSASTMNLNLPVPSKSHASNFVALSRSSTRYKRGFFHFSKVANTSITGSFTIDPQLFIPSGLTTVLPGVRSSNLSTPRARHPDNGGRVRENLKLEVENGGIDVDIHLVGFTSKTASLSNIPTRIELALKMGVDPWSKTSTFPLIARIHAPKPRPPFHLRASTIPVSPPLPALPPLDPAQADIPNSTPRTSTIEPGPTRLTQSKSSRRPVKPIPKPTNTDSKSPLTLHLPRTFRGPLTIHVAAGDIDAHVFLSKELQDAVVVLSETALARGYFVGGLVTQEGEDEGGCEGFGENQKMPKKDTGVSSSSNLKRQDKCGERYRCYSCGCQCVCGMAGYESENGEEAGEEDGEGQAGEWTGDRVEVLVGRGKVYLQFMGEKDPHRREGWFWTRGRW